MGRTYFFECSRCGFRAKVSGREDTGFNFSVQTIVCRDCKNLYDAVVRLKTSEPSVADVRKNAPGFRNGGLVRRQRRPETPPPFDAVSNRLLFSAAKQFRWVDFK